MAATAAITMGIASISGGIAQGKAAKTQGEFSRMQANENARLAEMQAAETIKQGEAEAGQHRRKVRGLIGSQRAALAAQGLDVSSGTAADVQGETAMFGEQDASRIKENAFKQAYGYRMEATGMRRQGQFDYMSGKREAKNSYLTGGLQALSYGAQGYGEYKKKT